MSSICPICKNGNHEINQECIQLLRTEIMNKLRRVAHDNPQNATEYNQIIIKLHSQMDNMMQIMEINRISLRQQQERQEQQQQQRQRLEENQGFQGFCRRFIWGRR